MFINMPSGGGGGSPTGAAGGDLGGTYPNPTVVSVADVTTGVLAPANGGVPVFSTADNGYFVSAGDINPLPRTIAAAAVNAGAQQVRAIQFILPITITVRHVTVTIGATVGSSTVTCGIYSADRATKLIDSGTFDGGTGTTQTNTITAVVLTPGIYWFAQSASTNTTLTAQCFTASTLNVFLNNQTLKKMGTAANSATAGVLPSGLGAITAGNFNPLVALFEP